MVKEITYEDFQRLEEKINNLEIQYKKQQNIIDNEIKKHENIKRNKNNKLKDPNMPKKPRSAYIFFYMENIVKYKKDNPKIEINVIELSKQSGKEWKSVKEDSEKYNIYKKMEEDDKLRYKNDINLYDNKKFNLD